MTKVYEVVLFLAIRTEYVPKTRIMIWFDDLCNHARAHGLRILRKCNFNLLFHMK